MENRSESDVVLVLRAAGCVFAEDEAALLLVQARSAVELDEWIRRRVAGEPLEVILGWAEFHGLRVGISPGVFVPRHRTEFLVDLAIALAHSGSTVVDLCCGSGALGLAVAEEVPGIRLFASDVESEAVACASRNLAGLGNVFEGDLFAALPDALLGNIDLLLVNAPYVPTDELRFLPPEARLFEPRVTLDGGADGLDIHRRVAADAGQWLAPSGTLLIETSESQQPEAIALFKRSGLTARTEYSDEHDATVVIGQRA